MNHPHKSVLPLLDSHINRHLPDTKATDSLTHDNVAHTLGLHRSHGRRAIWRYTMLTAIIALMAIGGWYWLGGRAASAPTYRTEAVERTREIGIRLAIGAFERDVMVQFLVEAVMLSLVGGLAGIGLGLACSVVAASVIGIPFILNLKIVVIAFAFSGLVGMVFGFFPARRAARLDPIDALRYE